MILTPCPSPLARAAAAPAGGPSTGRVDESRARAWVGRLRIVGRRREKHAAGPRDERLRGAMVKTPSLLACPVCVFDTFNSLSIDDAGGPWALDRIGAASGGTPATPAKGSYLVDPASSHMLVSKIKPCMSKYKLLIL